VDKLPVGSDETGPRRCDMIKTSAATSALKVDETMDQPHGGVSAPRATKPKRDARELAALLRERKSSQPTSPLGARAPKFRLTGKTGVITDDNPEPVTPSKPAPTPFRAAPRTFD
jgi:hypothetical protein